MVDVQLPDGTIRQFPSVTRERKSREIGGPGASISFEVPEFDLDWKFVAGAGGAWFAEPRRR